MGVIHHELFELARIDGFARQDTVIHRLDARVKVLTTLVFLVCVVSFPKHAVLPLLPFLLFPLVIARLGQLPLHWLERRLLAASPFAIVVGLANPLVDQAQVPIGFGVTIAAGWLSFTSILLRFLLTTAAALLLIATTGMPALCDGLRRLRVPEVFVTQLQLLYRYLFLLGEEAMRMERARDLRSCGRRGTGPWVSGKLLGALLLRTIARANRIFAAMVLRGFEQSFGAVASRPWRRRDLGYLLGWSTIFLLFRQVPVGVLLGRLVTGTQQ
ncbi:MAG: cobalt ECF transporter T component CbiQ [Cyanobium sp.]